MVCILLWPIECRQRRTANPRAAHQSHSRSKIFFEKVDADPNWFPGKHAGTTRGPKRVFRGVRGGYRHNTSTSSPMTHCFDVVVAPWWAQWGDHRNKTSTSSPTTGRLKLAVGVALRPPTVDLHTHTRQRRSGKFPNSECTLTPLKQWGEGFLLTLQIDSRAAMLLEYPGPRAKPQGGAVDNPREVQWIKF